MNLDGITLDIDVYEYLTSKNLRQLRLSGNNVMVCCPDVFHVVRLGRPDDSPSFGVNIDTGQYHCFGCGAKGTFASLVKELDGFDTVYDAQEYLIALHGRYNTKVDEPLVLSFGDVSNVITPYWIDEAALDGYSANYEYLASRGIKKEWQEAFEIGYNENRCSYITMPYRDEYSRLITVKCRNTVDKSFWYEPALPSRIKARTMYAFDRILRLNVKKVVVTEAEIDAISVWQSCYDVGYGAIAIGGSEFTDEQTIVLTRHLPSDAEIIVMTDNDAAGERAKRTIADKLLGRFNVTAVDWSTNDAKDANKALTQYGETSVLALIESRQNVGLALIVGK